MHCRYNRLISGFPNWGVKILGLVDVAGATDLTDGAGATDLTDGAGVTDLTDGVGVADGVGVTDTTEGAGVTDTTDGADVTDSTNWTEYLSVGLWMATDSGPGQETDCAGSSRASEVDSRPFSPTGPGSYLCRLNSGESLLKYCMSSSPSLSSSISAKTVAVRLRFPRPFPS